MKRGRRHWSAETLEPRHLLAARVVLSEFMAENASTLFDEDGAPSDWIELRNLGDAAQDLSGWHLTNDPGDADKWTLPAVTLAAGESLIVFASGKDRAAAGGELHANFDLPADAGYVALVRPDATVVNSFGPGYPLQAADTSFGLGTIEQEISLVPAAAPGSYLVPSGPASLPSAWTMASYDDAAWPAASGGIGFDAEPAVAAYPSVVLSDEPLHYYRFEETTTSQAARDEIGPGAGGAAPGAYAGGITLGQPSAIASMGAAARFSGAAGTYVNLGTPFHAGNSITVEAWVNLDAGASKPFHAIVARWDGSFELDVNQDAGAGNFVTRSGANAFAAGQTGSFSRDAWHHMVGIYDAASGTTTIWLDGVQGSTQVTGGGLQNAGTSLYIGATRDGAASGFNWTGLIDEVAIYDRVLTPQEIAAHYDAGTGGAASVDFTPHFGTSVQTPMLGQNAATALRIPFTVENPAAFDELSLAIKYDDGFVAYLNGHEIARRNAPVGIPEWNAGATAERTNADAIVPEIIDVSAYRHLLVAGENANVLAILGLNRAASDADLLLAAELRGVDSQHLDVGGPGQYFDFPTPGFANAEGSPGVRNISNVSITEIMARNDAGLRDEDGDASDWIELHNAGPYPVDLNDSYLTNDALDPTGWRFPRGAVIPPGGYLVVFASGKDRNRGELHADFRLDDEGEYLALVDFTGSVVSEIAPTYPPQLPNVSYGRPAESVAHALIPPGASARLRIASASADMPADWNTLDYDDQTWSAAVTGVGYDADGGGAYAANVLADNPIHYWRFEEANAAQPAADQIAAGGLAGTYVGGVALGQASAAASMGSAIRLDGVDTAPSGSRVEIAPFHAGDNITVEAWVRLDPAATRSVSTIVSRWDGSFSLDVLNSTKRAAFTIRNSANTLGTAQSAASLVPGQWHHVVGTFAGGVATVYLDGVPGTPVTRGGTLRNAGPTPDRVLIGAARTGSGASGNNWLGEIDEVAVYSTPLAPTQIAAHASALSAGNLDLSGHITTDIAPAMHNMASIALTRIPFSVARAAALDELSLRVKYDDGFVVYLNGTEVARRNALGAAGTPLAFDAVAPAARADSQAVVAETIDLSAHLTALRAGENVLAIAGLNRAASDADFLLAPELVAVDTGNYAAAGVNRYFVSPSPGALNSTGLQDRGPIIADVSHSPHQPADDEDLVVTARVGSLAAPPATVTLRYRVMFAGEVAVAMTAQGNGTYRGVIPASAAAPGQMVRYYVTAADNAGNLSRWPLFPDPAASEQYLGTVVADPTVASALPIWQWFVQDTNSADNSNQTGARASVFYLGEFYDNVFVRVRGATAGTYPKKPYKFDFNKGHYFRFAEGAPRVSEINVNATFQDKALVRAPLSMETYRLAGTPAPDAQNIRVERNGDFFSVAVLVEQVDESFLERRGFDPDGALYKFVSFNGISSSTVNVEKKTQKSEPNADLQEIVAGLALGNAGRANFVLDHFDVPAVVNYLAAGILFQDFDRTIKNYYLYRDPRDDEWQLFPWDKDLTFGLQGLTTDLVQGNNDTPSAGSAFIGHPFFGTTDRNCCGVNHLFDAVYDTPLLRELVLRRLRTLMDEFLQPPDSAAEDRFFERRLDELKPLLQPDATLDLARWGAGFGALQDLTTAMNAIRNNYLAQRRVHLYQTHSVDILPGGSTTAIVPSGAPARAFVPTDDDLGLAWTEHDYDDDAWLAGTTGVGFDRLPDYDHLIGLDVETQMFGQAASVLIRVPFTIADPASLRNLILRMKYDDGFVAYINGVKVAEDNVPATLSWLSTANAVRDDSLALSFRDFDVSSFRHLLQSGENVLAVRGLNQATASSDMLIVPELVTGTTTGYAQAAGIPHAQAVHPALAFATYEVSPASGDQEQEYLELTNPNGTALDLTGWTLSGGVTFTFAPGTVIPAGGSLFVSPDVRAFRARTSGPTGGAGLLVVGPYSGHLSTRGETVELRSPDGHLITSVTTPAFPSAAQQFLRITEVMYHPADPTAAEQAAGYFDGNEFEFIELHNTGAAPLALAGITLAGGVEHTLQPHTLPPGEYAVVVKNPAAFRHRYGPDILVLGEYAGTLNNAGERLELSDVDGNTVLEFTYDDSGPGWHPSTDGDGYSLEIVDALAAPSSWDAGQSWQPSLEIGGSPGKASTLDGDINGDLRVDLADLAVLQANLGIPSGATRSDGDLNGDGAVDRRDVVVLSRNFGRTVGSASPAAANVLVAARSAPSGIAAQPRRLIARQEAARRQASTAAIDAALSLSDQDRATLRGWRQGKIRRA